MQFHDILMLAARQGGGTPAPGATAEIWLLKGDSLMAGVLNRETGNGDWSVLPTGVKQYGYNHVTGLVSTVPLDCPTTPADTDVLSVGEYFIKQRKTDSGINQFIIQYAVGGSKQTDASVGWAVGGTLHETSIASTNTAIAAILAVDATAVFKGYVVDIGTNDSLVSTAKATFYSAMSAADADFRDRVFVNGVSGAKVTSCYAIIMGQLPEFRATNPSFANDIERAMQQVAAEVTNGRYFAWPTGVILGDNLHPTLAGDRSEGPHAAALLTNTTAPVITFPSSFSIYSGQKLARKVVTDIPCYPFLSGTDAASFEIVGIDAATTGATSYQYAWTLRVVSNGNAPAAGTYNVTINARGQNGVLATPVAVTITVAAAYGTQVETIVATNAALAFPNPPTDNGDGRFIVPSIDLKRGFNHVVIIKGPGSYTDVSACVASNGLVGTKDANALNGNWPFYFYSAQNETVDLYYTPDGTPGGHGVIVTSVVGTVAAASSSALLARGTQVQTTSSLTCPASGIIIGGGFCVGGTTEIAGVTQLNSDDAFYFSGYRTTTGAFGISENADGGMAAVALAKA